MFRKQYMQIGVGLEGVLVTVINHEIKVQPENDFPVSKKSILLEQCQ